MFFAQIYRYGLLEVWKQKKDSSPGHDTVQSPKRLLQRPTAAAGAGKAPVERARAAWGRFGGSAWAAWG